MSHKAPSTGRLQRAHVLSPITALAFYHHGDKQYLLAAQDTDIQVYDTVTSHLCGTLPVFSGQPIHGIAVSLPVQNANANENETSSAPQILIWGGRTVKVLPGQIIADLIASRYHPATANSAGLLIPGAEAEAIAPDWIFCGRISPFGDGRVVLLTAHNEVIQGHVNTSSYQLVLDKVQSPSRPILYSGNLSWIEEDVLLVAAGTVFGEILVWKCFLAEGRCEMLFSFSGHEGSIFGVSISPEIRLPNGEVVGLLVSCSDDRTIRVWDITEREGVEAYEAQVRDTGFGEEATHAKGCVAMAMGHVSRIWDVDVRQLGDEGVVEIHSFGEDATMQKWHLDRGSLEEKLDKRRKGEDSDEVPAMLVHQETFANHSGKQIWAHAIVSMESGLLIATGGADGKISLMDHERSGGGVGLNSNTQSSQELEISMEYLLQQSSNQPDGGDSDSDTPLSAVSRKRKDRTEDMILNFTFITEDRLLVTTRAGRVFIGTLGSTTKWEELSIAENIQQVIRSYVVLGRSRSAAVTFIGASNGELFHYHESNSETFGYNKEPLQGFDKADRKVTEIICLTDGAGRGSPQSSIDGYTEILVTVFGSQTALLTRVDPTRNFYARSDIHLPSGFVPTAASWCCSYLIVGSRHGKIAVFQRGSDGYSLTCTAVVAERGDRITSILPLPRSPERAPKYTSGFPHPVVKAESGGVTVLVPAPSEDCPIDFLTTSRDGKYRIHQLVNTPTGIKVRLLHESRPPISPMIEGSWLAENADGTQDIMLCGFRSKFFVVWNVTRQQEIATIECGGGHRLFDYMTVQNNPETIHFACTKTSKVKLYSQERAPHQVLKTGGHGREVKAMSVSGRFLATGAEDTMIRIWDLGQDGRSPRCVLALEQHKAGIQKIHWYKDEYLFSSGGMEEFYVWRVSKLDCHGCPIGVVCEAVFTDRSEVGDLRIMDFDVRCLNEDDREVEGHRFCITMALSNSAVQSYEYDAKEKFSLLGRREYTGACLTQLKHLGDTNNGGGVPDVLAAATDGHLAVFTDKRPEGIVAKLHQSTIKSLDMRRLLDGSYLIVTGGDDNAIGIAWLDAQYRVQRKFIVRSAHGAAVTGIGIVRLENGDRDVVLVSSSNDQRVKTWRLRDWRSEEDGMRVELLDDAYSGVADAGDLAVWAEGERGRVLVAGVGFEVWDIG
ncbi:WD40 repeat-like protein [Xylariaceae sp. FL1019]|nr:WD40 repeat-like protein [Xylariaceae sp. FL1019]